MRICYLAFVRLPTEKAHGLQIVKTCEALAKQGSDIELLVPGRATAITQDPFSYYGADTFPITTLHTPDWVRWGKLGFILSLAWFAETAQSHPSFKKADIIYSRDALLLFRYLFSGRKLVYEAHTKPTIISKIVAQHVQQIVVISEGLRDTYNEIGISHEKITVAHDAIDPKAFTPSPISDHERKVLGLPSGLTIALYVGRIDEAKGAQVFAEVSTLVPDNFLIVLVGGGPLKDELVRSYPKAVFLPETPYRDIARILSVGDMLVLPNSAHDADTALYTSPLKAFAYLAAKKPIVASNVPSLRAIFGDEVRYAQPDNAKDLAEVLINPATRSYVPQLEPNTWDMRANVILSALTRISLQTSTRDL